jgi:hypothetical protein
MGCVTFRGLTDRSDPARKLALVLACGILAGGGWFASRRLTVGPDSHSELRQRREELLTQLASLEEQHRAGAIEAAAYAARRRELMARLEEIYAALHEGAAA